MDIDNLRIRMAQLPEPITDKRPPYWEFWRHQLWQLVQSDDPARFWKWPCIFHTMLVNHWPDAIKYELEQLDLGKVAYALQVPHFGPDDYMPHTNYSMNLIHQAYHLHLWEQTTGQHINQLDTIAEFGGGYGAMALLCHRLGFEGKYIIYDLPEFSLLQEYYLSQFGLLDKVQWNTQDVDDHDLTIALYSISEVEPDYRLGLLPIAKSYLFLYSGQWESWDNVDWFQKLFPYIDDGLIWRHTELTQLPDPNNFYSIGYANR